MLGVSSSRLIKIKKNKTLVKGHIPVIRKSHLVNEEMCMRAYALGAKNLLFQICVCVYIYIYIYIGNKRECLDKALEQIQKSTPNVYNKRQKAKKKKKKKGNYIEHSHSTNPIMDND